MSGPEERRRALARWLLPLAAGLSGLAMGWAAAPMLREYPTAQSSSRADLQAERNRIGGARDAPLARSTASPTLSARADLQEDLAGASLADMTGVLMDATTRLDPTQRLDELSVVYRRYAELDPQAALEHALTQGAMLESAWSIRWVHDIFYIWARKDLEAAVQAAPGLDRMKSRAALGILAAIPQADQERRSSVADALNLNWDTTWTSLEQMLAIARDPEAAFRRGEPDQTTTATRRAAARAWAASRPQAAADAVAASFESIRDAASLRGVLAVWSQADVDAAAAWVLRPKATSAPGMIAAAASGIASVDPARAVAIAESLSDPEERSAATASAFGRWAGYDPQAAANRLATIGDAELRASAVRPLGLAYARLDPLAAYRWAVTLPPDEAARVLPNILIEMARSGSPERASRLVADIEVRTARNNAAVRVAEEWARQSPADALGWSREFEDEAQQSSMVQGVFARWAFADGQSALRRMKRLEPPYRLPAAEGLLRSHDVSILESVYNAAEDPALRAKAARRLAMTLSATDRKRALDYRAEAERLGGN